MPYTATLDRLLRENGKWSVVITFSDGTEKISKGYTLDTITKQQLRSLARTEAERLLSAVATDIDIPIGTTIDVTPTPPPKPTQAQINRAAWFDDYDQLRKILRVTTDIPVLLTPQAQTQIASLRTSLNTGWKNSYLDGV